MYIETNMPTLDSMGTGKRTGCNQCEVTLPLGSMITVGAMDVDGGMMVYRVCGLNCLTHLVKEIDDAEPQAVQEKDA